MRLKFWGGTDVLSLVIVLHQTCGEFSSMTPDAAEKTAFLSGRTVFSLTQAEALQDFSGTPKPLANELLGDYTRGPDSEYAANGFEALRKWGGA